MPRLRIRLPEELGNDGGGNARTASDSSSRRLGSGIEGADEQSRRLLRWLSCWARSDD